MICTARLKLRPLRDADLDFLAQMMSDAEVMRYYPQPYNRNEVIVWLKRQQRRYQKDGCGLWGAELHSSNQLVGQVGLVRQQIEGKSLLEVGYMIHRQFWRQGFAFEAASGCVRYAADTLHERSLHCLIHPDNIPSRELAQKLGMRLLRQVDFHRSLHDLYGMNLIESGNRDSLFTDFSEG